MTIDGNQRVFLEFTIKTKPVGTFDGINKMYYADRYYSDRY